MTDLLLNAGYIGTLLVISRASYLFSVFREYSEIWCMDKKRSIHSLILLFHDYQ